MSAWWLPLLGIVVGLAASFTGLGGGFIVVPLLVLLGFAPQRAVGTSFVAILVISLASLFGHARFAAVDWKAGALIGLGGIVGAQIGPRLLQGVTPQTFQRIFAVALAGLAVWMYARK